MSRFTAAQERALKRFMERVRALPPVEWDQAELDYSEPGKVTVFLSSSGAPKALFTCALENSVAIIRRVDDLRAERRQLAYIGNSQHALGLR